MDTFSYRVPLGVTAGVCPFNFPAMIPLWMFPMALATGNTMILKPSEQDPGAAMMLVQLAKEAGVPDGCVNIIHGQHDTINFICDNPDIMAISFVGGDAAVSFYLLFKKAKRCLLWWGSNPRPFTLQERYFTTAPL